MASVFLAVAPDYTWDDASGAYRNVNTGRYVARTEVVEALRSYQIAARREARAVGRALREGRISIAEAQLQVAEITKNSVLASAAAARGGWDQLTQADYGRAGQIVRTQYEFLRDRMRKVESGEQKLDGTIENIFALYPGAGTSAFYDFDRREQKSRGMDRVINIQHSTESCAGCIEQTALGEQDIDAATPPGQRTPCRSNCQCRWVYLNSATGEMRG